MPFYNNLNVGGALNSNHIYYNISVQDVRSGTGGIVNGVPTEEATNGNELVYTFNESRAQPYLIKPEDYFLSVVRFTMDSPNLPVFIPIPVVGQNDVNKLIYTITIMGADGISYQRPVTWISDNLFIKSPVGPVTNSMISPSIPYYYCHSYEHFVDLINNTFKELITDYNTAHEGKTVSPPYVFFDANTKLFQLGGDVEVYRTDSKGDILAPGVLNIFFNVPLLNILSSLPASYVAGTVLDSGSNVILQADYKMILSTGSDVAGSSGQPIVNNVRTNPITSGTDVYAVQEYETLPLWTPITGIIFKTTLLSTAPENMATPVVYQNNNQNINAGRQNAEVLNILADHYAPTESGSDYSPYIYYEPTGEYKLTDLYGKQPIDSIDIQVYWRDRFGNLVPFYLALGATSTIKILFRKKIFNSNKI
jgi:hypothetical protein